MRFKELVKKFIPPFLLSFYHYSLALMGAFFYGFPSRKMTVIGVTGTNGKSTVVNFTTRILEEAGFKTASLSSIKFKIGDKEQENKLKMTMPGRFKLRRFLRQAIKAGCKYVVLEVTSEGIKQHRHQFVDFNVAVLTNLTPEHIESHKGFENYRKAKLKLFERTKNIHIINLDDKSSSYFLKVPSQKKYRFGLNKGDLTAQNIKTDQHGISFDIKGVNFYLNLIGEFNIYNALAAVAVALSQGISLETCSKALRKAKGVPGRMEIVLREPFVVIVDYAFTPAALEKVYQTSKNTFNPKKMICVLGACGGGRDKWKRPVLGKIAQKHCQEIIVTNEDPYDENPMEIINQVVGQTKAEKILDRKKAIAEALKKADPGDLVIITGKGSEPLMCVADGKKISWDDRKIAKEALTFISKNGN